jgi:isopentenyl diphosphate isomerase/L-lactate dehydrogenase-like FMN-dependent dehydrogenase
MQICQDPSKGLTQTNLERVKQENEGSFIEDWFGSTSNFLMAMAAAVGTAVAVRYRFKKLG